MKEAKVTPITPIVRKSEDIFWKSKCKFSATKLADEMFALSTSWTGLPVKVANMLSALDNTAEVKRMSKAWRTVGVSWQRWKAVAAQNISMLRWSDSDNLSDLEVKIIKET